MNNFFRNLKIRIKLFIGFGIIIFVILLSGIREINVLKKLDNKRINSSNAAQTANMLKDSRFILENEISLASDYLNALNINELKNAQKKHINNNNELNIISEYLLKINNQPKAEYSLQNFQITDSVKSIIQTYNNEINISFEQLLLNKDREINIDEYYGEFIKLQPAQTDSTQIVSVQELKRILEEQSLKHKSHIKTSCNQIISKVANTENIALEAAQHEEKQARELFNSSANTAILYILFLLIFSTAISILISSSIVNPLTELKEKIDLLTKGELPEELKIKYTDEIGEMGSAINQLVSGLKITSEFSLEIGKENFDTEFKPLGENDVLGNSLLSMRDSLLTAKRAETKRIIEDAQRNRTSQGLALFGDILRKHTENIRELSNEIISGIVKFMNANQGGIFILNDENKNDIFLDLTGAYAYNRKKFIEKKIRPGEGLVGSVAIEKYTIYMTEVPDEYIEIESGLGSANPKSILIVPLKMEREILGVIELASFNEFEQYEIQLVEKIAESIASTLSTARINSRTAMLLEQSNKQASKMREQEEELLQNIEELKATQEESDKREEYLRKSLSEIRFSNKTLEKRELEQEEKINSLSLENKRLTAENTKQTILSNSIIENTPDIIIICDKFGVITAANKKADKIIKRLEREQQNVSISIKNIFDNVLNKELTIDEYKLSNLKNYSIENEKNQTVYFNVSHVKELINNTVSYVIFLREITREISLSDKIKNIEEISAKTNFENNLKIDLLQSILKENKIKIKDYNFDDIIYWTDSYGIGIEIIDQQHKRWVLLANQVYRAYKKQADEAECKKAFKEFIDYTDYHFGFEEKYMIDFKYKKNDSHKNQHKEFLDKLRKFSDDNASNQQNIETYKILEYIKIWINRHIFYDDIDYVELFLENGLT